MLVRVTLNFPLKSTLQVPRALMHVVHVATSNAHRARELALSLLPTPVLSIAKKSSVSYNSSSTE